MSEEMEIDSRDWKDITDKLERIAVALEQLVANGANDAAISAATDDVRKQTEKLRGTLSK